uniref:Amino acid transporter transmembrane domain-containing protein n=1 Tax=Heliothis virescens TaxID=7102 RepID=A0A2A4K1J2_HELVI
MQFLKYISSGIEDAFNPDPGEDNYDPHAHRKIAKPCTPKKTSIQQDYSIVEEFRRNPFGRTRNLATMHNISLTTVRLGMAVAAPSLGAFMGLLGALCLTVVAILFPALMDICASKNQGGWDSTLEKLKAPELLSGHKKAWFSGKGNLCGNKDPLVPFAGTKNARTTKHGSVVPKFYMHDSLLSR